jgi:hypothetical protein
MPDHRPLHFIGETIMVGFDAPPTFEKKPDCPQRFVWREQTFEIVEVLQAWVDYARRGRFARNMQPQHAAVASQRGSWGVGRFHFRVRVHTQQLFELYYDREPKSADQRKGAWFLVSELEVREDSKPNDQDSTSISEPLES